MPGPQGGHDLPRSAIELAMNQPAQAGDKLIYVDPSPIARRLLWHLFSIGSRRMIQTDRHGRFEKPGAHLFWLQSGAGELEYRSSRFELKRGKKVWLGDMGKPRTYIPAPGRHLAITGFRFGGPGLEFWHEEFNADENAEFTLDDFNVFTRKKLVEKLRYMHNNPVKRGLVKSG